MQQPHCPLCGIFAQCNHALYLAISVQYLSTSATTHIISLSSGQHLFSSAIMHIISLSSAQHLSSVLLRPSSRCPKHSSLSSGLSCTSSRCLGTASFSSATMHIISQSQYSIFQHCNHTLYLAVLGKGIFHQCIMHIISLSSEKHLSPVQPCTSSRCPQ